MPKYLSPQKFLREKVTTAVVNLKKHEVVFANPQLKPNSSNGRFQLAFEYALLAFLFISALPIIGVRAPSDLGHFFSSIHMFEFAYLHSFQFGTQIIDNVGPYGFVHYPYVQALSEQNLKTFYWLALIILFSFCSLHISSQFKNRGAQVTFILVLALTSIDYKIPWYSYEIIPRLLSLFMALMIIGDNYPLKKLSPTLFPAFTGIAFGIMSLVKISQFMFCIAISLVLIVFWLHSKQHKVWLAYLASFCSAFLSFWLLADQEIKNIPDFIHSVLLFINGYQSGLGAPLEAKYFWAALTLFLLIMLFLATRSMIGLQAILRQKILPTEIFFCALLFITLIVSWKHGLQRGLYSYSTFMFCAPTILALVLFEPLKTNKLADKS